MPSISGSGTSALVFRLVVASGQQDNNGITVGNSIQLNRGSLRDLAGNDGAIALTPGSSSGVLVDGVVPTVADVIVPANGGYKAGDVLSFTVNASEAVFTSGSPRLAVDIGGTTRYANFWRAAAVARPLCSSTQSRPVTTMQTASASPAASISMAAASRMRPATT